MYRQIFIDGRPLPDDPTPGWNGYSTAHWEGETLVVQTAGFRDNLWIDTGGSPMSDVAKMTERMRRPNYGTLELEITIDDPKVYTRPFTVNMTQNIELDTELIDEFCLENEKSYERMQNSRGRVTLPSAATAGGTEAAREDGPLAGRVPARGAGRREGNQHGIRFAHPDIRCDRAAEISGEQHHPEHRRSGNQVQREARDLQDADTQQRAVRVADSYPLRHVKR